MRDGVELLDIVRLWIGNQVAGVAPEAAKVGVIGRNGFLAFLIDVFAKIVGISH